MTKRHIGEEHTQAKIGRDDQSNEERKNQDQTHLMVCTCINGRQAIETGGEAASNISSKNAVGGHSIQAFEKREYTIITIVRGLDIFHLVGWVYLGSVTVVDARESSFSITYHQLIVSG